MASKKFSKGSEEWLMFTDYWTLCQKLWIVEDDDNYWNDLIDSVNEFYEKYKSIPLAKELALAFCNAQDLAYKPSNRRVK